MKIDGKYPLTWFFLALFSPKSLKCFIIHYLNILTTALLGRLIKFHKKMKKIVRWDYSGFGTPTFF